MTHTLIYVHDPMCSWCWALRPALTALQARLPADIGFKRLLGGLAADTMQPMPEEMRANLQGTWQRIQQQLPHTPFNFDFWEHCQPRRSTYPACRAVIAARMLDSRMEDAMIHAIQRGYYTQARNPSDVDTLLAFAMEIGLDQEDFVAQLHAAETNQALQNELSRCSAMHIDSFPSLRLQLDDGLWPVPVDYSNADNMLETITSLTAFN